ncbi:MAG: hypothetical protein HGA38_00115 [Candidatus Moranbacteria bacterium]|nr:hypothetical protein [Candidatus Moranbacteria bacterium]NTW45944.1 hypothetical protein [Candidatus Moranbacteria bacterium]
MKHPDDSLEAKTIVPRTTASERIATFLMPVLDEFKTLQRELDDAREKLFSMRSNQEKRGRRIWAYALILASLVVIAIKFQFLPNRPILFHLLIFIVSTLIIRSCLLICAPWHKQEGQKIEILEETTLPALKKKFLNALENGTELLYADQAFAKSLQEIGRKAELNIRRLDIRLKNFPFITLIEISRIVTREVSRPEEEKRPLDYERAVRLWFDFNEDELKIEEKIRVADTASNRLYFEWR